MMRLLRPLHRRFAASTQGMAAIEFAMILPVLMVLFLGTLDGGRAIAIYMKVRSATYALDAITNQYTTVQASDMTGIMGAITQMMQPYSSTPAIIKISQVKVSAAKAATISWGVAQGGSARAQGSSISLPSNLAVANTYLIFAEVSYTYTPLYGYFSAGSIALADNLYSTPRSSTCIIYVPQNGSSC
jgi:Flp pilus assembly protein TadG